MATGTACSEVTLRRIWSDYRLSRNLKPRTEKNYEQRIAHLADWLDIPARHITKDMVERRHREIGNNQGRMSANYTFKTLNALLHYAELKYVDQCGSPYVNANAVKRLTEARGWYKEKRRRTFIPFNALPAFFQAIHQLDSTRMRDIFLLLMFTGLRSGEARTLQWADVDLSAGVITLHDTKNGHDATIPLSSYAWRLLRIRRLGATSRWVFPGYTKKDAPLASLWGSSLRTLSRLSGVTFCPHDLRRLFISIGDDLEIKTEIVKALVNHVSDDVTEGYTIRSVERLRRSTQRITDAILYYAGAASFGDPVAGTVNHRIEITKR